MALAQNIVSALSVVALIFVIATGIMIARDRVSRYTACYVLAAVCAATALLEVLTLMPWSALPWVLAALGWGGSARLWAA